MTSTHTPPGDLGGVIGQATPPGLQSPKLMATLGAVAFVVLRLVAAFLPRPHPSDGLSIFIVDVAADPSSLFLASWIGVLSAVAFVIFAVGLTAALWRSHHTGAAFVALVGTSTATATSTVGYGARLVLARRAESDGTLTEAYALSLYDLASVTTFLAPIGYALVVLAVGAAAISSNRTRASWFAWPTIGLATSLMIPIGDTAFFAMWLFFLWVLFVGAACWRTAASRTESGVGTSRGGLR